MTTSSKNLYSKFFLLFVFFLVIFLDQISKYWAQLQGLVIINSGISFSLFQPGLAMILLFFVLAYYLLMQFSKSRILLAIFMGAAFSNILDRMVYSGVRDWLPVPGLTLKNNLADWLMFLVLIIFIKKYANRDNF